MRLDPKNGAARYQLGRSLLEGGDADGAVVELEAAARLEPKQPVVQQALAAARKQQAARAAVPPVAPPPRERRP